MSGINFQNPLSKYEVAGYKVGDRIGGGTVVDPATLKGQEVKDTKLVTVDLNLNGKADPQDDKVMVKLPPKGYVPADWKGSATWTLGDKVSDAFWGGLGGTLLGGIVGAGSGGLLGVAVNEGGILGQKLATQVVANRFLAGGIILGVGVGIGLAYAKTTGSEISADSRKARESAVPDLVQPKYILNQYLQQQPNTVPTQSN